MLVSSKSVADQQIILNNDLWSESLFIFFVICYSKSKHHTEDVSRVPKVTVMSVMEFYYVSLIYH